MNILNIMKRTSIVLGLLLIPTIINSSYQYVNASDKKQSSSDNKDNKKQKNDRKASKAEIEAVKNMYKEFQEIINSKVTEDKVESFYNKHFASNTYQLFGIKKSNKDEFNKALINYFVNLLSSDLIQKTKGYELTDKFSKINKEKTIVVKCQLKKNGEDDVVEMSVTLTKDKKIRDFSIMNSFQLVRGARNIVDNYCKDKKGKKYKKFKATEKADICKEAWEAHFKT